MGESKTDKRQDAAIDDQQDELAQQAREIADQAKDIAKQEKTLEKELEQIQDLQGKTANIEAETEKGNKQRLRLFIPNPKVTVSLGEPTETVGYVGFSTIADDNVFMSATNGQMFLQSYKQMAIQTPDEVVIQSNLAAFIGSNAETFVTGKKGVVVLGGEGPTPAMKPIHGEEVPELRISSFEDIATGIENWGKVREAGLALLGGALAAAGADRSRMSLTMGAGALAGAVSAIKEVISSKGSPVVAVHGTSGVSVVAPNGGVSIAGTWGVGICSAGKVEMISPIAAEVFGGAVAGLVSVGKTGVESGFLTEILSMRTVEIAARTGACEVMGKDIGIGKKNPGNALIKASNQLPTSEVSIEATGEIKLNADAEIVAHSKKVEVLGEHEISLSVKAPPPPSAPTGAPAPAPAAATPDASIKLDAGSGKAVEILVGDWMVRVDGKTNRISIGKTSAGATIQIDDDNITIGHNNGEHIVLNKSNGITMNSKNNLLEFKSAGVKINGSSIKLGS